jgi:glycosyltransferase involved in cell wall biosynthesis
MHKLIVVIPVYNHERAVGRMVDSVFAHDLPCLLVDDGSNATCADVLATLAQAHPGRLWRLRLPVNQGKGSALMAGFVEASRLGYTHVLQIDADGQHDTADLPRFAALSQASPGAVICGCPRYDESVPTARRFGRYLTHVWVWINTLSFAIRDSMCGFRVYPLRAVLALMTDVSMGRRMEFDTEVIVRLVWRGVDVVNVPTRVTYPLDGVSHFDVLRDNLRISRMHATLFAGMLVRAPLLVWRRARRALSARVA